MVKVSKIRTQCLDAIRKTPGMLRYELYRMGIGHKSTIQLWISRLVYERTIVRIWDDAMDTWRLYPKGKEPEPRIREEHKKNLYSHRALYFGDKADSNFSKAHGEKFRILFDEMFRILYIDLKMIAGACGMMDSGSIPSETEKTNKVPSAKIPPSCAHTNYVQRNHANRGSLFPARDNTLGGYKGIKRGQASLTALFLPPPPNFQNSSHPERAMCRLRGAVLFDSCNDGREQLGIPDLNLLCPPAGRIARHEVHGKPCFTPS